MVEEDRLFTEFGVNVKGMSPFTDVLVIEGDIDAVADGTTSKLCDNYPYIELALLIFSISVHL